LIPEIGRISLKSRDYADNVHRCRKLSPFSRLSPFRATEEGDVASDQLWMGSYGGAGDEKCSRTTGGNIDTTPYLFARDGQGTIVSKSTDVVVLATNRVDIGGDMKVVFATSRALCEKARKKAQ
jgi:hypothetical protein